MTRFHASPLLRRVLILDAATCLAAGLLMAIGGGYLAALLGFPEALLRYAGLFLVAFAGIVWFAARQARISKAAVVAIIACNAIWAIESVAILLTAWVAPNTLGIAFVIAQAAWVAVLAVLQSICLRRASTSGAAVA